MKITCTGPKGEKFEASGGSWTGGTYMGMSMQNDEDRKQMQKALETWCDAMKANKDEAVITL